MAHRSASRCNVTVSPTVIVGLCIMVLGAIIGIPTDSTNTVLVGNALLWIGLAVLVIGGKRMERR